ncbi:MAG: hypothetical protein HQL37_05275 [Alphaproteobacteria bacterium]|nr:hypothetical protein [Alphaproteobacteria bacterium]
MSNKRVISINLTLGTLLMAGGGLYPFAEAAMNKNSAEIGAQMLAADVLRGERTANADKTPDKFAYVYFPSTDPGLTQGLMALAMSPPTGNYTVEAFQEKGYALVIRAFSKPEALAAGKVPAVIYEHRIPHAGEAGVGSWVVAP